MFWDRVSPIYDFVENLYNREVYDGTGKAVADLLDSADEVLECACGTGAISRYMARSCKRLTATDCSEGMLRRARKKLGGSENVVVEKADIMRLGYADGSFDKAVAGNVIHLLPEPDRALGELARVVRDGGKIIVPTYISLSKKGSRMAAGLFALFGAGFRRQFDMESYRGFFAEMGYSDVAYSLVEGRMPCAIAVITKAGTEADRPRHPARR